MLRTHSIAIAFALTACAVSPFATQTANAKKPTIISSSSTATDLIINGEDLGPGAASVLLGSFPPLAVKSQTPTQLVVTLPGTLTPGNYVLSVQVGKAKGDVDESVVTIGASGGAAVNAGPGLSLSGDTLSVAESGIQRGMLGVDVRPLAVYDGNNKFVGYPYKPPYFLVPVDGELVMVTLQNGSPYLFVPQVLLFTSNDCSGAPYGDNPTGLEWAGVAGFYSDTGLGTGIVRFKSNVPTGIVVHSSLGPTWGSPAVCLPGSNFFIDAYPVEVTPLTLDFVPPFRLR